MHLFKSLLTVSSLTFISRILGLIRDVLMAAVFGASGDMDAFIVAFKLPNTLRRIFAEGAFAQSFTPFLAAIDNKETQKKLIAKVFGALLVALVTISFLGVIFADILVALYAPGFAVDYIKYTTAVNLTRIMFPYILLVSLAFLFGAISNVHSKFAAAAFMPALLNISIIISLWIQQQTSIYIVAVSVMFGGALQIACTASIIIKLDMFVMPNFRLKDSSLYKILQKMCTAIAGVSAGQISLWLNTIFASFLTTGSFAWMYYADRLMELPAGVIGAAMVTVVTPSLAKLKTNIQHKAILQWGIKMCLIISIPCACGLFMLSEDIITAFFAYGKFDSHDVLMSAYALQAYCIGLPALILVKVLAASFYAIGDVKTPVRFAIVSIIVTQVANILLVWYFQHVGLAFAISIGAIVNTTLLGSALIKNNLLFIDKTTLIFTGKIALSSVLMASGIYLLKIFFIQSIFDLSSYERVLYLFIYVLYGVCIYVGLLFSFKINIKDLLSRVVA